MVALQIRDVPDDVRQTLAERASRRGQSLQSFLLKLVTDEASRAANVAILTRFENRNDGSSMSAADAALAIDQARAERDPNEPTTRT
jgi:plasmid stability protein